MKKFLAVMLAITLMVMALVSCGNDNEPGSPPNAAAENGQGSDAAIPASDDVLPEDTASDGVLPGLTGRSKEFVAVSAGAMHTVGLRADGTAAAIGNNKFGQCDVSDWTDIIAISAGRGHTVGLRSDGTVITAGNNEVGARFRIGQISLRFLPAM